MNEKAIVCAASGELCGLFNGVHKIHKRLKEKALSDMKRQQKCVKAEATDIDRGGQ